ncbi:MULTISPECIES: hypothetical protein [Sphingomonas]|uniref:hypothetical protein n=1 Tax=Sphingomonas TaxID=13687 RepID=UPI000DBBEBC6|nr:MULTISPECIES: hypothetical protein [Sphingomonas]PZT92260.1 MAG: hypothetical protein DI625_12995 [Sphingomonas sp.]RSV25777.1 hypothetical protein CA237_12170 [Sphingomonas sp. ABOLH]WCP71796.1 hypothetical protein PPZ50_15840 [Sphingomonas hankookensis]
MIDPLVTVIALGAAAIARVAAGEAASRSPVARALRRVYGLTVLLLALRLIGSVSNAVPFVVALMIVAAWLPLAGLRLAEELCRRHAQRWVKLLGLGGGVAFTLVALTLGVVWSEAAIVALAVYQSVMLALTILLLAHERAELKPAERRTLDTFLLALLLTIPLALSDFHALFPELPVRGGAIAVLVIVLGSSRLADGRGRPSGLIADLAVASGACGLIVLAAWLSWPAIDAAAAVRIAAAGWAVVALLLLVERRSGRDTRGSGLIAALARAPMMRRDMILSAHPLLESGQVIDGDMLTAYPPDSIERLLCHPVIDADLDDEAGDAGRDLLQATQATHLIRLSRTPPRWLAIAAGGLAGAELDDEIAVAARLIEAAA